MKTLRALLREDDPLDREPALAPQDVERMRRAVLASAGWTRPRHQTMRVGLAAAICVALGVSAWLGPSAIRSRSAPQQSDDADRAGSPTAAPSQRRQLQFATPGGTRIIWVFDSNFDVR